MNVLSILSWISVPSAGGYSASKAAAWSLTNWLRTGGAWARYASCGGHAGPIDTEMAKDLTLPKVTPKDVVQLGLISNPMIYRRQEGVLWQKC